MLVFSDTGLHNQNLKESASCLRCTKVSEYDIMRGWVTFMEIFYCADLTDKRNYLKAWVFLCFYKECLNKN